MSVVDAGLAPGSSVRYQMRATDADGNIQYSAWSPYITVSDAAPSPFAGAIAAGNPSHYWRLNEPTGPGPRLGRRSATGPSPWHPGRVGGRAGRHRGVDRCEQHHHHEGTSAPLTPYVTHRGLGQDHQHPRRADRRFRCRSTGTSASGATDRVLYLDNSGRANFAINNGSYRTVTGRTGINDGQWHHVVGVAGGTASPVRRRGAGWPRPDGHQRQGVRRLLAHRCRPDQWLRPTKPTDMRPERHDRRGCRPTRGR